MCRSKLARLFVLLVLALSCGPLIASQNVPGSGRWNGLTYDEYFSKPYIDVDEWRDTPVRHRYVHGGFTGTDTLFSMYFPPKEQYRGRFFQPVAAVSGNENAAQQQIAAIPQITNENTTLGFAIASGAYLIESNLGAKNMYDNRPLTMWPASAATAKYSRQLAAEMYGPHRPYGYMYGGSGGGFKTINGIESTSGVWDGVVPYVIGSPIYDPNVFSVQAHATRILKDKWRDIVDAIDPGGSGDMYATLNGEEHDALREVTRFGLPPRAWFAYSRLGYGPFAVLIDGMVARDPGYFDDFWTVPGYLGANPPESLKRARVQHRTTIARVVMSDEARKLGLLLPMAANGTNVVPSAFQLADMPKGDPRDLKGATLIMKNGGAEGQVLGISSIAGEFVTIGMGSDAFRKVNSIKVGDEVVIDNSIYLAAQTWHRHQSPRPEFRVWDQFRSKDGKPLYPLRPLKLREEAQDWQTGRFAGKMILVCSLVDELAYPWQCDWYRESRVKVALGSSIEQQFRLWYTDNAMHGSPSGRDRARIVPYTEVLQQALRDVSAWVEKGIPPPASTSYKYVDGQIEVPPTAAARRGIQAVVTLTANGKVRADVKVGEPVRFAGIVDVPPDTGRVVDARWDFEGTGDYPVAGQVIHTSASGAHATVTSTYAFSKPGTYFPALRASSQRNPDTTPYARVQNLARVRVVVR